MLNYMRQNAGSRLIKILLLAIAASFIIGFGFLPSVQQSVDRTSYAALIDGEPVSGEQLQRAYRNLYNAFREQFGDKFDPKALEQFNLPQMALDQLIARQLKLAEARRLEIEVSDEQVRRSIREIPAFQQDGGFNKDIYLRLLQFNRTTPAEFEAAQREDLMISLVEDLVRAGAQVTPAEAEAQYREENEKVAIRYLEFASRDFESRVERPDEDALRAYLDAHADKFRTPRRVKVDWVSFPFEAFGGGAATDEEVRAQYDRDIDKYRTDEQVRARHILIQSQGDDPEARGRAEKIAKRARSGEDFATLAAEYSDDPGSKTRGGDLGFFPRGRMVAAFEEAAFSLEPGKISDPVKTDFGYHVIRVEERKAAGTTPLEEVRDEIAKAIVRQRADAGTRQAAEDFRNAAAEGAAFTAPAGAASGRTDFIAPGDDVGGGIGRNYLFTSTASRLQPSEVSKPIRVGEGYTVLRAAEIQEPRVPPFEEIADRVFEAYRADEAKALARAAAGEALDALRKDGAEVDTVAAEYDLTAGKTDLFTRKGPYIPGLGASTELKTDVFALTTDAPVAPEPREVRGNWVVAVLDERSAPTDEEVAAALPEFTKGLVERRRADIVRNWTDSLRRSAKIAYNDALLERIGS